MKIEIEWLTDSHDCETCGINFAEGARVTADEKPFLDLTPMASCFGGDDWSESDVFKLILEKLGHEVLA